MNVYMITYYHVALQCNNFLFNLHVFEEHSEHSTDIKDHLLSTAAFSSLMLPTLLMYPCYCNKEISS